MTNLGFKIKTNLALKQCTLYISRSVAKRNQMTSTDVKTAWNIANVRIYTDKAIKYTK